MEMAGLANIPLHRIIDYITYWVFFWNLVYVMCPPREIFNSPAYDKFLQLVSYYGSLNLRKVTTGLYGVVKDGDDAKKIDGPSTPGKS